MARGQDFISAVRTQARAIVDAVDELNALEREWTWGGYSETLPDGVNQNEGITRAEIADIIGTTRGALNALLDAGNGTNLTKVL